MNQTLVKISAALLSLFLVTPLVSNARSVRIAGNGGNAFVSKNGSVRFLDLVRQPSKELIDLVYEGDMARINTVMIRGGGYDMTTYFPDNHGVTRPVRTKMNEILGSLTFFKVAGPIPNANDSGTVILKWKIRGKIVPLAIQDKETATVLVDRALFDLLPKEDRTAFFMHEGFIRMYTEYVFNPPLQSTEKIGSLVHASFQKNGLGSKSVARYLCDIGIAADPAAKFELLPVQGALTEIQLPTVMLVFSQSNGKCQTAELVMSGDPKGTVRTGLTPPWSYYREYSFVGTGPNGEKGNASLLLVNGRKEISQTRFESSIPGFATVLGDERNAYSIVRDHKFSFWSY